MKNSVLLLSSFLLILSCKKTEEEKPVTPEPEQHVMTATVIATSQLPIGGGYINANGNLLTFSPPTLLNPDSWEFFSVPECIEYDQSGNRVGSIRIPGSKSDFFIGCSGGSTINGIMQWYPCYLKLTFLMDKSGKMMYCNAGRGKISTADNENYITYYSLNKLAIAMTIDTNDALYVLTAQVYDGQGQLIETPKVLKITPTGDITELCSFPNTYTYISGNRFGDERKQYSSANPVDITVTNKGDIFVAFGFLNKVFKISQQGILEEWITDITMPVSVTSDTMGNLFVVSSAVFLPDLKTCVKPVEVIKIGKDKSHTTLYSRDIDTPHTTGLGNDIVPGKYVPDQDKMNINSTPSGKSLFFENALTNEIVFIH